MPFLHLFAIVSMYLLFLLRSESLCFHHNISNVRQTISSHSKIPSLHNDEMMMMMMMMEGNLDIVFQCCNNAFASIIIIIYYDWLLISSKCKYLLKKKSQSSRRVTTQNFQFDQHTKWNDRWLPQSLNSIRIFRTLILFACHLICIRIAFFK